MSADKLPPGWFEGSLRYLELYSDVMKRGPWNAEGGAMGDAGQPGLGGDSGTVAGLGRLCSEHTCAAWSEA